MIFKIPILLRPNSQNCEGGNPKTNVLTRALICPFFDLYPAYHPAGGVKVLEESWNLLSDDVKAILQRTESKLNALNTADL